MIVHFFKFHRQLFPNVQLSKSHRWLNKWLGAEQAQAIIFWTNDGTYTSITYVQRMKSWRNEYNLEYDRRLPLGSAERKPGISIHPKQIFWIIIISLSKS